MSKLGIRVPWAVGAATVVGYAASIVVRRHLLTSSPEAAIWLSAVVVAGLLMLPQRARIATVLVCIAVNAVSSLFFSLSPRTFLTFPLAVMVVYGVEYLLGPSPNFADPRKLALYLAGVVTPACAVIAAVQLWLPMGAAHSTLSSVVRWSIGHFLGLAILVPSPLILTQARRFRSFNRPRAEMLGALAVMTAAVVFLLWNAVGAGWPLALFPMAMFIAFRYGPIGVSLMSLMLTTLAIAYVYGARFHVVPGQTERVQILMALVYLTSLPAAGAIANLKRMQRLFARRTEMARVARTRADQAARARGEFLANMSHEIRTPLNGVIGLADALSRTPLEAGQKEMLGMILGSGQALRDLLSDALDLARIQSGALSISNEAFDPRQTIGAAAYLFEALAKDKGLEFKVAFDIGADRQLVGDPMRIRQIVSNLISNAVKFTEHGAVEIDTKVRVSGTERARLCITVRDSGRGFDEETKARLFNRFEQGDNSVTRRYGGSGLGLSIVRELSTMMEGEVTCSATPGLGSVFVFEVELLMEAAAALAQPEETADEAAAREALPVRKRVLLAEDHVVNQKVVQALIGERFDLMMVGDGQAAIDAFKTHHFDLILMDTHMPVMDGLTAIRQIRALEQNAGAVRTPIVSLTADALAEHIEIAYRAGADAHLAKPITAASLLATLAAVEDGEEEAEPLKAAG